MRRIVLRSDSISPVWCSALNMFLKARRFSSEMKGGSWQVTFWMYSFVFHEFYQLLIETQSICLSPYSCFFTWINDECKHDGEAACFLSRLSKPRKPESEPINTKLHFSRNFCSALLTLSFNLSGLQCHVLLFSLSHSEANMVQVILAADSGY